MTRGHGLLNKQGAQARNLIDFEHCHHSKFGLRNFTVQVESHLRDQVGVTIDGTRLSTEVSLQDFNEEISHDVLSGKLKVTCTQQKSCASVSFS